MALEKELLNESGIVSTYHRILNVEVNYVLNECVISIVNYKDESFREREKNLEKLKASVEDLNQKYESETSEEIKTALLDKIKDIKSNSLENKIYYTNIEKIHLDYVPEDLSYSALYKIVSSLESFDLSKDV